MYLLCCVSLFSHLLVLCCHLIFFVGLASSSTIPAYYAPYVPSIALVNVHPMLTCAKVGIYKPNPRLFFSQVSSSDEILWEPKAFFEAN